MNPRFAEQAVSGDDISAIEKTLGLPLPRTYRDFLVTGNSGVPSPGAWGEGVYEVDVVEFYPPTYILRMTDRADLQVGKLNIAECAAGDHFAIDLKEGTIFFREHEHPVDDRLGAFRPVAGSFEEFIAEFHEPNS